VSRDSINANSPVVVVVPLTDAANVKRTYPSHVHFAKGLGGLKMDSIAKLEQIRAIHVTRFISYGGRVDAQSLARMDEALKITLALR
jgi:mRNA interferase MazF